MKNTKTALRLLAFALACVMLAAASACQTTGFVNKGSSTPAGTLILGQKLNLTAVNNNAAQQLVNDSGMSGLEASNHLAGTDSGDMYTFENNETLVFSLPRCESLGQLYIWNYSESGKTNCGVKELNIQYSVDGSNWQNFGNVTLNEASQSEIKKYGGCVAANYGDPINLNGVSGKYIAPTPISNHGGDKTGLSEIRIFRHKLRPGEDYMITGYAINTARNVLNIATGTNMEAALNNQGMSDLSSKTASHSNVASDMWHSSDELSKSYMIISLDGTYPVKEITLWNYNAPDSLADGVKEFKVLYTVESPCSIDYETQRVNDDDKIINETFDFSKGDWKELSIGGQKTFTLPQGDGSEALSGFTLTLDTVTQMQHVKIVPVSNYGGSGYGLSEVRFFAGSGWGIEPSRDWTGLLSSSGSFDYQGEAYERNGGWVGADGIFSINLDGPQQAGSLNENSRVFISFQDTVIANMNNYRNWTSRRGYKASHSGWVNMSWLFLKGNTPDVRNAQFVLQGKDSDRHPYNNICAKNYWIGETVLINGTVYGQACEYFGWDTPDGPQGYDILAIPIEKDGFADLNKVPNVVVEGGRRIKPYLGQVYSNTKEAGAPNPDGYLYIFGKKSDKWVVSRCKPEDYTNYDKWERYNGESWVKDDYDTAFKSRKCYVSVHNPGNESGVMYSAAGPFAGQYVNIFTEGSVNGQLKLAVSDSLVGKFGGPVDENGIITMPISIMWATEKYTYMLDSGYDGFNQWNYNAKTHPALSKEGEMLISYHQSTIDAWENTTGLEYVHPVFYNMFQVG